MSDSEGESPELVFSEHKGSYLITMGAALSPRWEDLDCVGRLICYYTKSAGVKWWVFQSKDSMVYDQVMHDAIGNKLLELNAQEKAKAGQA